MFFSRIRQTFFPIIISVVLLIILAGCRISLIDKNSSPIQKVKGSEKIVLKAKVIIRRKNMILRGQTNLPKGSIMHVNLKQYDDNATQLEVINNMAKTEPKKIETRTFSIEKDGNFSVLTPRGEGTKRHRLELLFNPIDQPEEIQNIYGSKGENIGESEGLNDIQLNGNSINIISLSAPIVTYDEGGLLGNSVVLSANGRKFN